MKKKFWLILLTIVSALCLAVGLAACDLFDGGGNSTGGGNSSGTQAGTGTDGSDSQTGGSGTGGSGSQTGGSGTGGSGGSQEGHTHSFALEWSHDSTTHWHEATCDHTTERGNEAAHIYQNGKCRICQYEHEDHNFGENHACTVCGKYLYREDGNGKIYFGEYPQTEVTDENDINSSLRNSLNMAAGAMPWDKMPGNWTDYNYYITGKVSSFMWYIDIPYQGNRYRGVYFTSYRPYYTIKTSKEENSYQKKNGYKTRVAYWFKYEPIEWRVLEKKDGVALLMANSILDSQQYYHDLSATRRVEGKTVYANNYKESDIRTWLNETFLKAAFDTTEQSIIETTDVDNSLESTTNITTSSDINPFVCENTQDKVFLLSGGEVLNASYGFGGASEYNAARRLRATAYAKSQGILVAIGNISSYSSDWWLRSPYPDSKEGGAVRSVNSVGTSETRDNCTAHSTSIGVVPALRIKL